MMGNAAGKHRPSFKMVSNMVIQLLHSIKYSVEVPFSNMAPQPPEIQKSQAKAKVSALRVKTCGILASESYPRGILMLKRVGVAARAKLKAALLCIVPREAGINSQILFSTFSLPLSLLFLSFFYPRRFFPLLSLLLPTSFRLISC